jgi:cell division septum initiation protein DivIVA
MANDMSMQEVEPELGAIDAYELAPDEPPFPVVLRGYDRRSVEDFVDAATARVAELESLALPSLAVKQALEQVADDTGGILQMAHETADEIMTRAREDSERMVREAREEAERTVASAQARARQIGIDTDGVWQERMRLIEDAQAISAALADVADAAATRFPADEPIEAVAGETLAFDAVIDQPTETLDVAELWAAEDAAAGVVAVDDDEAAMEEDSEALVDEEPEALVEDEAVLEDAADELEAEAPGDEPEPAADRTVLRADELDDLEPPPEFRA